MNCFFIKNYVYIIPLYFCFLWLHCTHCTLYVLYRSPCHGFVDIKPTCFMCSYKAFVLKVRPAGQWWHAETILAARNDIHMYIFFI